MKLLDGNKKFYKANLHCHTTLSDGEMTPEEVKKLYMENGYSIVAYTDHEILYDNSYLNDDRFLALVGVELATNGGFGDFAYLQSAHFNFIAKAPTDVQPTYHPSYDWIHTPEEKAKVKSHLPDYPRKHTVEDFNKIIAVANENGFLSVYAHPIWSMHTREDYKDLKGAFAVEVYNTSGNRGGCEENDDVYEDLLRLGNKLHCVCADDNHHALAVDDPKSDCCGGWIQVQAEKLSYSAVIDALEKGNFYSSTGPSIYDIDLTDNVLTVTCSPCVQILVKTSCRATHVQYGNRKGELITSARFTLNAHDAKYFRVVVMDERGARAYSNAYYDLVKQE